MTEAAKKLDVGGQEATATLEFAGKTHEFKVRSGSVGPDVIDIASLYSTT
ncbi:citrate (Si)-synthase, partial [Mesorhizobium sp. M8A.F.Ca.ET.059.01.1.1]